MPVPVCASVRVRARGACMCARAAAGRAMVELGRGEILSMRDPLAARRSGHAVFAPFRPELPTVLSAPLRCARDSCAPPQSSHRPHVICPAVRREKRAQGVLVSERDDAWAAENEHTCISDIRASCCADVCSRSASSRSRSASFARRSASWSDLSCSRWCKSAIRDSPERGRNGDKHGQPHARGPEKRADDAKRNVTPNSAATLSSDASPLKSPRNCAMFPSACCCANGLYRNGWGMGAQRGAGYVFAPCTAGHYTCRIFPERGNYVDPRGSLSTITHGRASRAPACRSEPPSRLHAPCSELCRVAPLPAGPNSRAGSMLRAVTQMHRLSSRAAQSNFFPHQMRVDYNDSRVTFDGRELVVPYTVPAEVRASLTAYSPGLALCDQGLPPALHILLPGWRAVVLNKYAHFFVRRHYKLRDHRL